MSRLDLIDHCSKLFMYVTTFRRTVDMYRDCRQVRDDIRRILKELRASAQADPELSRLFDKAELILAYAADQLIRSSDWRHVDEWDAHLIEDDYKTHPHANPQRGAGGNQFFVLLSSRDYEDARLQMLFYVCICLGFKGEYGATPEGLDQLERIRKEIYDRVDIGSVVESKLTPEAYDHTLEREMPMVPIVRTMRLVACFIGLIACLWVVSGLILGDALKDITRFGRQIARRHLIDEVAPFKENIADKVTSEEAQTPDAPSSESRPQKK